jgi:hypothetical protein
VAPDRAAPLGMSARAAAAGRLGMAALLAAGVLAIVVQDHSGALPLGLFNDRRAHFALASGLSLAGLLGALAVFVWEWRRGPNLLGSLLRTGLVSFLLLEGGLRLLEGVGLTAGPDASVGGPYYEKRSGSGPWVFLKKGSGFRTPRPYSKQPEDTRGLFLGDSYTEGSGGSWACNYPQVVERALARRLERPIEVMNAGVAGYGPRDAANLLDYLVARGYAFDAVVYNLFLENDFSDNLPGTERRVVAGINFRFPASIFLRLFHPLNTHTFRYLLFAVTTRGATQAQGEMTARGEGICHLWPDDLESVSPELRALVERRLEHNYAAQGGRLATGEVRHAIERMRAVARERDVPFAVVVFPDRILADDKLRALLPLDEGNYELDRLQRWIAGELTRDSTLDLTTLLRANSGMYQAHDTHLSDMGNVIAGEYVAQHLPGLLSLSGRDR